MKIPISSDRKHDTYRKHTRIHTATAAAAFLILSAVFIGCSAFTDSFGAEYFGIDLSRDTEAAIADADVDELTGMLSNPAAGGNTVAVLDELGSEDAATIQALDTDTQTAILNATVAAALPVSDIVETLAPLLTGDSSGETDTSDIISSIIESIPEVNTSAAAAVLTSPEVLAEADISTVTMAAVSVLAQVVSTETADESDTAAAAETMLASIQETIGTIEAEDTPEALAAELVADGTISADSQAAIEAVLTTVMVISGTGDSGMTTDGEAVDRSGDIGDLNVFGFDLGSLLGLSTPEE